MYLYVTHATRALQIHCLSEERINSDSHYTLTTQGNGGPPQVRDQLNDGAISEATQTWKTIQTIQAPIHPNKANTKG